MCVCVSKERDTFIFLLSIHIILATLVSPVLDNDISILRRWRRDSRDGQLSHNVLPDFGVLRVRAGSVRGDGGVGVGGRQGGSPHIRVVRVEVTGGGEAGLGRLGPQGLSCVMASYPRAVHLPRGGVSLAVPVLGHPQSLV